MKLLQRFGLALLWLEGVLGATGDDHESTERRLDILHCNELAQTFAILKFSTDQPPSRRCEGRDGGLTRAIVEVLVEYQFMKCQFQAGGNQL